MGNGQTKAIVLAAGKGTRMKSDKAKVMHEVFSVPMLQHVLDAIGPLDIQETVVVTGHQADVVEAAFADSGLVFARQEEQLGTAHAVLAAEPHCGDFHGTLLILCGDTPLVRTETLRDMLRTHVSTGAKMTVMTTIMSEPTNYGRIVTDGEGNILRIVEEKDATAVEKEINEINAGIYCVDNQFLFGGLREVDTDNRQGEFYLTDLVGIARNRGFGVGRFLCDDPMEVFGVNSKEELARADVEFCARRDR
jgi:bifunctional UDP-N-acetylglucosamine pyrophosphorylase/glucosamine-1-phosphate N-acetyltransferase